MKFRNELSLLYEKAQIFLAGAIRLVSDTLTIRADQPESFGKLDGALVLNLIFQKPHLSVVQYIRSSGGKGSGGKGSGGKGSGVKGSGGKGSGVKGSGGKGSGVKGSGGKGFGGKRPGGKGSGGKGSGGKESENPETAISYSNLHPGKIFNSSCQRLT